MIALVQGAMNLFAGLVSLLAVTVAVIMIQTLLLPALLVATLISLVLSMHAGG